MTTYNPQALQQKLEKWHELKQQQIEAQKQWVEIVALSNDLKDYYQSEQWIADRENNLELTYSGNVHSILSEDALWNMLTDTDELALKWMRLGLDVIERR